MRLSQGHLNLLATCPRKFQHTYLDQLASPMSPEQQERLDWGSRFHLLMQQRELGLPIEAILAADPQFAGCLTAFINSAPEVINPNPKKHIFRQAEHERILNFQNYILTVRYDLLIAEKKKAQIHDWKTYPRPQNRQHLEHNWQTRLYLYVLAETSPYLPQQISITYWFVQASLETPAQPNLQNIKFIYDRSTHEKTQLALEQLLQNLTIWLENYQETGEPFPQIPETSRDCEHCHFSMRCHRASEEKIVQQILEELPNLATIQEIKL